MDASKSTEKRSNHVIQLILCSFILSGLYQITNQALAQNKIYKLNPAADIFTGFAGSMFTFTGLRAENNLPDLSVDEVIALNPLNVNRFDRRALNQDVNKIENAISISDLGMYASVSMVLSLGFDRVGRHNGSEILIMYLEAVSVNLAIHTLVSYGINRYRPIAYMEEAEISLRTDYRNKSSFFSGHTSTTATCSFFIAKVWSDLHPELGNKKILLFAAAFIPVAVVGNFRIRGGKHFYTDALTGAIIGGAIGILVPELHKIENHEKGVKIFPILTPYNKGIGLTMKI